MKQDLKPVYFIYSQHELLLKEAFERLTATLGSRDAALMDVAHFTGADGEIDGILAACQALSFLGGKRLVVIDDFMRLPDATRKKLIEYIEDPNPQTILVIKQVFDAKAKKNFEKSPLIAALKSNGHCQVAEYEIKSGIAGWIRNSFAARHKKPSDRLVHHMLTWVGTDLNRLSREIDKVCDAVGPSVTEIDLDAVKALIAAHREADVFEVIGAITDHNAAGALIALGILFDREANDANIFSLIERQFRLILATKTRGRGLSGQKLAGLLGVSQGQAYHLERQSRAFSLEALKKAVGFLAETDYMRKSSPMPMRPLLETLVVDLCALN